MATVIQARAFIVPKAGEQYTDIQDSFGRLADDQRHIALADGVSQSLFPREWADIIVGSFNGGSFSLQKKETHAALSAQWRMQANEIVNQMQVRGDKNTWVFENQLTGNRSAGATFVGLLLSDDLAAWTAEIIGDSCIAEVDSEGVITAMYASQNLDEEEFGNYPDYLDSAAGRLIQGNPVYREGAFVPGQKLLMVTDALAHMLNEKRKTRANIRPLLAIQDHEQFVRYVAENRLSGLLKNDDTTAIILDCTDDAGADMPVLKIIVQTNEREEAVKEKNTAIGPDPAGTGTQLPETHPTDIK